MTYTEQSNQMIKGMGQGATDFANILSKVRSAEPKAPPVTNTRINYPNLMSNISTNVSGSTPASTYKNLGYISPDIGKLGTITTQYGSSTKFEGNHPGVDIANKIGTQIPSFEGGKVLRVDQGFKQGDKGFGNSVIVQDAQGNKFRYSHLNKSYVKVGDVLSRGQVLGEIGNSGSTYSTSGGTGSHLDLRIRDAYGKLVDPLSFLKNYKS